MKNGNVEYCSSVYIIDRVRKKMVLIYHKKYENWVQPGGHLKDKETPLDGAIRKALEETGLHVIIPNPKPFMVEEFDRLNSTVIDYQFLAYPVYDNEPLKYNESSYDIDWFSLEEMADIPIFPDIRTKARMFLSREL